MSNNITKAQDAAAIVQGKWNKLYQAENKAWSGAWPEEHRAAYLQFVAGVRALVNKDPRLLDCPDFPIRLIECAGLGLLPHFGPRGEAIIMYAGGKDGPSAALIVGYKGYATAWQRDGIVKPGGLLVAARMPKDKWVYRETAEGTKFLWEPDYDSPRSYDGMKLVFARALLREGGCVVGIRTKDKCEQVKSWATGRGKGSPAWQAWPLEMGMKGAVAELKRVLPFGQNTERLLEYEAEREEKDMGTVQRVDLSQAQPITATLPAATRIPEVVEPPAEPVKVEAQPAAEATKMRIQDDSVTPDVLLQMKQMFQADEVPTSEQLKYWHANMPRDATREESIKLYGTLQKRAKSAAEVLEPGARG